MHPQHVSPRYHATMDIQHHFWSRAEISAAWKPLQNKCISCSIWVLILLNSPLHPSHWEMCSYKGPCLPEQEIRLHKAHVANFSMCGHYPPLSGSFPSSENSPHLDSWVNTLFFYFSLFFRLSPMSPYSRRSYESSVTISLYSHNVLSRHSLNTQHYLTVFYLVD